MTHPRWKAAAAFLILCNASVAISAEPEAVVVSFDFTNQKFTSEFVDWVARYGAKKAFVIAEEKTLSDIVAQECGQAAEPNLSLFKIAISEPISFEPGQTVLVPPCLPTVKTALQPRIAAYNDRFWTYYKKAASSLDNVEFKDQPVETYSSSNPPQLPGEVDLPEANPAGGFEYLDSKALYVDFSSEIASAKDSMESSVRSKVAVENFWKRKALSAGPKALDTGQLAYDTAFMKDLLDRYGQDVSTDFIVDVGLKPNAVSNDINKSEVVALADTAANRWSGADFGKSAELAAQVTGPHIFGGENSYIKRVKWFTPDATEQAEKALDELQPGDLVVSPSVVSQKIQIPVDRSLIAPPDTQSSADVPAAFDDASGTVPQVENLQTFNVGELSSSQCVASATSRWDQPAFVKLFRETAFRTRLRVARDGRTSGIEAKVVVADSGFVAADERGPFTGTLAMLGGDDEKKQRPAKEFDENQRTHGTSVAGLAIGGPKLWPLASALGIKLEVIPRRIFDARVVAGGKTVPFFMDQALQVAASTTADVYNLSFGSRDKDAMDNFRENYFRKSMNKLFVIAAGNNNLNDGDKGVDLGSVSIYPQYWAGHLTGANVLLVASLDGDKLASFSNYSSTRISLAAPGCAVNSWKPSNDDSTYDEKPVTGTSFSTPIVSYVAALVKALSPPDRSAATWVRARMIASADLTSIRAIEHGRVFNPIKAISLYEDVVELNGAISPDKMKFGRLQWTGELNDICDGLSLPEHSVLLKFARDPEATSPTFHVYFLRDDTLDTSLTCAPRADAELPLLLEDGTDEITKISDVKDIVFRYE